MKRMKVTDQGIQCPWCPTPVGIAKCGHNPFKLVEKIDELTNDVSQLSKQLAANNQIVEGFRLIKEALDET